MTFDFATAGRILFGAGKRRELAGVAREFGSRALIVTGADLARSKWAQDILAEAGFAISFFSVPGEPGLSLVQEGACLARISGAQVVVSIGGGSVIDAGKAIAALATNTGEVTEYLEVIGAARPLSNAPVPFIALPTTAGTGAEVTRNAVLASPEHQLKVSLRSAKMLPRVAIVDPELTCDLPPKLTASTGMDALTQLIEPFLSSRANALTDGFCRTGIALAARALPAAFENGRDQQARTDMSLASLLGGLALANAGLGAVHGFAAPIGGMFPAPHGAVCAALLPHALKVNLRALRERSPAAEALERFGETARLLTGDPKATAEDGIAWVEQLTRALEIPRLGTYGVTSATVPLLCSRAAQASSMKANPVALTPEELADILEPAI